MVKRVEEVLKNYCEASKATDWSASMEEYGDHGSLRGFVMSDHFANIQERQADVWAYLREHLSAADLSHIGTIQTLAPGEAAFEWRD